MARKDAKDGMDKLAYSLLGKVMSERVLFGIEVDELAGCEAGR